MQLMESIDLIDGFAISLIFVLLFHTPCLFEFTVPGKRFIEDVRRLARSLGTCSVKVIHESIPIIRVRTVFNDRDSSFLRSQAAKIRVALLGYDDHDFMLGVIHMRTHRNDGRNRAVLCNR